MIVQHVQLQSSKNRTVYKHKHILRVTSNPKNSSPELLLDVEYSNANPVDIFLEIKTFLLPSRSSGC